MAKITTSVILQDVELEGKPHEIISNFIFMIPSLSLTFQEKDAFE